MTTTNGWMDRSRQSIYSYLSRDDGMYRGRQSVCQSGQRKVEGENIYEDTVTIIKIVLLNLRKVHYVPERKRK